MTRVGPKLAAGLAAALALTGVAASPARAQDNRTEASVHFNRGLEFFNEGRHDAALAEFEQAYALSPAYQVLYNLARVHAALGHAVEATDAYERYLREGSAAIAPARRAEVDRDLARQRDRIGRVAVDCNVEGATVSVDGLDVATTPLDAPLRVSAGAHSVGVRAPGYEDARRAVTVAGGVEQAVRFELRSVVSHMGTLRITAHVGDVAVFLDGEGVGTTPLHTTFPVPAGHHVVTASRPGYVSERHEVDVADQAEVEIRLAMHADANADATLMGTVELRLPDAPSMLRVDGQTVIARAGELRLPAGEHEIEIEMAEREPFRGSLTASAGERTIVSPALIWTPEARAERLTSAQGRRTAGLIVTLAGGVLVLAGGGLWIWNAGQIADTDEQSAQFRDVEETCTLGDYVMCWQVNGYLGMDATMDEISAERARLQSRQDREMVVEVTSFIVGGVGLATAALGLVLWLGAASDADVDADAHASRAGTRLGLGPGRLQLEGWF